MSALVNIVLACVAKARAILTNLRCFVRLAELYMYAYVCMWLQKVVLSLCGNELNEGKKFA